MTRKKIRTKYTAAAAVTMGLALMTAPAMAVNEISSDKTISAKDYDMTQALAITHGAHVILTGNDNNEIHFSTEQSNNNATLYMGITARSPLSAETSGDLTIGSESLMIKLITFTQPGNWSDYKWGTRLHGAGSRLKIYAETISSDVYASTFYAQQGSTVEIGTKDHPVTTFKARAEKNDYGCGILHVNNNATITVYAKDMTLDGSILHDGGVISSGNYGTITLHTTGVLNIDGTICGSYGGRDNSQTNKIFRVDINPDTGDTGVVKMSGDITAGYRSDAHSPQRSREVFFTINSTGDTSSFNGKIDAYEGGNIALNYTGGLISSDVTVHALESTNDSSGAGAMKNAGTVSLSMTNGDIKSNKIENNGVPLNNLKAGSLDITLTNSKLEAKSLHAKAGTTTINADVNSVLEITDLKVFGGTMKISGESSADIGLTALAGTTDIQAKELNLNGRFRLGSYGNATSVTSSDVTLGSASAPLKKLTLVSNTTNSDGWGVTSFRGSKLQIYADMVDVSADYDSFYVEEGGSINIGDASHFVKTFTSKTLTDANRAEPIDANLHVNNGATITLYAENASLTGPSSNKDRGVISSGNTGTITLHTTKALSINGNICGIYGGDTSGGVNTFAVNINPDKTDTGTLEMTGNITAGYDPSATSASNQRTVDFNINSTGNSSRINGDIEVFEQGRVGVNFRDGGIISGDIITHPSTVSTSQNANILLDLNNASIQSNLISNSGVMNINLKGASKLTAKNLTSNTRFYLQTDSESTAAVEQINVTSGDFRFNIYNGAGTLKATSLDIAEGTTFTIGGGTAQIGTVSGIGTLSVTGGELSAGDLVLNAKLNLGSGDGQEEGSKASLNTLTMNNDSSINGTLLLSGSQLTLSGGTMTIGTGGVVQGPMASDIPSAVKLSLTGGSLTLNGGKLHTNADQVFINPTKKNDGTYETAYGGAKSNMTFTSGGLLLHDDKYTLAYSNSAATDLTNVTLTWYGDMVTAKGEKVTSVSLDQVQGVHSQTTLLATPNDDGNIIINKDSTVGGKDLQIVGEVGENVQINTNVPLTLVGDKNDTDLITTDGENVQVTISGDVNLGDSQSNTAGGVLNANIINGKLSVNGNEGGDAEFTVNGNVSGDLYHNSGTLLVSGDADVKNLSVGEGAKTTINGGVKVTEGTLEIGTGGALAANNVTTEGTVVTIKNDGHLKVSELNMTGGSLAVGNDNSSGDVSLILDTAVFNNVQVVLDPIWHDGEKLTGNHAFKNVEINDSQFYVGQGSGLTLGDNSTEWLTAALNVFDPKHNISAALGLYTPIELNGSESKIVVDGSYNGGSTVKYEGYALYLADGSALVVNMANLKGNAAAITAAIDSESSVNVESDAVVYLSGAKTGQYTLASGFTGGFYEEGTRIDEGDYDDPDVLSTFKTESKLLKVSKLSLKEGSAMVVVSARSAIDIDPSLARYSTMIDSFVQGDNMGTGTPAAVMLGNIFSQNFPPDFDPAIALECTTNFGSIAAGPALGDLRQVNNALASRFGMNVNPLKSSSVWAIPYYAKDEVSGMSAGKLKVGYDSKNYGVVTGWDKRLGNGRVGVAVHVGKSDIDGSDWFRVSKGDGKYFGAKLYGDWNFNNWQLMGDIGFGKSTTDLDHIMPDIVSFKADNVDAKIFSVGARAMFTASQNKAFALKPFVGARFTRYSQDAYDIRDIKSGGGTYAHVDSADMNVWNFSLGAKFDWRSFTSEGGWQITPTAELAYERAAGDRSITQNVRFHGNSTLPSALETEVLDDNAFSIGLGISGQKNNFTMGVNLKGLFSSNQKNYGVNATVKWDF